MVNQTNHLMCEDNCKGSIRARLHSSARGRLHGHQSPDRRLKPVKEYLPVRAGPQELDHADGADAEAEDLARTL